MSLASMHSPHSNGPDIDAMTATMVDRLTSKFNPLKIVLFGSRARGDAKASSDIDVLVVLPDFPFSEKRNKRVAVRRVLQDVFDVALEFDVLVSTPQEIERIGHVPGWLLHEALQEGKVLHERR